MRKGVVEAKMTVGKGRKTKEAGRPPHKSSAQSEHLNGGSVDNEMRRLGEHGMDKWEMRALSVK